MPDAGAFGEATGPDADAFGKALGSDAAIHQVRSIAAMLASEGLQPSSAKSATATYSALCRGPQEAQPLNNAGCRR